MYSRYLVALAVAVAAPSTRTALAQRPSYDRHFLDSTEYFISSEAPGGPTLWVAVAQMVQAPSPATRNEGQYLVIGAGGGYQTGQRVWTRNVWRTRPATTEDIAIGAWVFCLNAVEDNVYRPPRDRGEAINAGWFMVPITDASDLFRQEVRAGEHRISVDCLRVNAAPRIDRVAPVTPAAFDAHFLDSTEYFITDHPLSEGDEWLAVARMINQPTETSRGDAQFVVVGGGGPYQIGQRVWTRYYWRTRVAQSREATVGRPVFCLNAVEDDANRAPRDRAEALNSGWFRATITDTSDLFRQVVAAGDHRLSLGCLRVVR